MNIARTIPALTLSLVALGGCASEVDTSFPSGTDTAALSASVRVLHLSPDAPAVDVFVDGTQRAVSALPFAQGTGYLDVPAGTYDFNVAPAGGTAEQSVLDIIGLPLEGGKRYTAVAYGAVANITALPLEDDFEDIMDGSMRVRAIHAASGVGQVDIWNVTPGTPAIPLYQDVDFGVASGYADIPAGAYTIGFDVDDDANPDVSFTLPALGAGEVANIFAINDGAVALIAQLKDGTTARIDANP